VGEIKIGENTYFCSKHIVSTRNDLALKASDLQFVNQLLEIIKISLAPGINTKQSTFVK
jgi:hypothetical protein